MAQLTLYLPDAVALRLKREARRAQKSLSAFVVERLQGGAANVNARQGKLRSLFGSCKLPEAIPDAPPDEVEEL